MAPDIALLVNPAAGRGRGHRWSRPVVERLQAGGLTVDVLAGDSGPQSLLLALGAVSSGVQTVVALGGDGLVHLAAQAVAGQDIALGIVPAGTGNDFARALGLPRNDAAAAADVVIAGHTRQVDAGRVTRTGSTDTWFAGVVATGFDSQVNERANRMHGPAGRVRYVAAMLAELRTLGPTAYEITVDDELISTDAVLVAVGNGPSYGGGMRIAPGADLADGRLDVTLVGPLTRRELLQVFPRVYTGSFVSHPAVRRLRGRSVHLAAAGAVAYADGERLGPLPVAVTAVPGALRVVVPAPAGTTAQSMSPG